MPEEFQILEGLFILSPKHYKESKMNDVNIDNKTSMLFK